MQTTPSTANHVTESVEKAMTLPAQIAKHLREVFFGGNWTDVNLKDTLADITWQQAIAQVHSFNTIAALVFHINYYVAAVLRVLQGGPLRASDKYSFALPPIEMQNHWEELQNKLWTDAETLALLAEQLTEDDLQAPFSDGKYGNNYRNLAGVIEHTHYHLGQIMLVKKLLGQEGKQTAVTSPA